VSWIDALVNGCRGARCTPSTCQGGCDKDLSGILIDGFVFRFAACQFGQKTAGSPLGCLVRRTVARFFARLTELVHVAAWVDDLIFIMSTPEHGKCDGFEGGCAGRSQGWPSTRTRGASTCCRTSLPPWFRLGTNWRRLLFQRRASSPGSEARLSTRVVPSRSLQWRRHHSRS
jgi:hypothetical protein